MECFGIEISAIGPLDRSERGVELDGVKQRNVLEWSEHLSFQDGTEIDPLLTVVVEPKRQRVRADDHEVRDAVDGMTHDVSSMLVQWLDLDRWPAGLQERPVLQQFFPMDFCPGLDQPLLRPGKFAADALDRVQREYRLRILIRGVEVRPMVRRADFHEHPDDDAEEPR